MKELIYFYMGFFSEKLIKLGVAPEDCFFGCKITVLQGVGCIIEGHKGIISYGESAVQIRLKTGKVNILGENLSISEISKTEMFIIGKVFSVSHV